VYRGQLIVKLSQAARDANSYKPGSQQYLRSKGFFQLVDPFDENDIGLVEFGKDRDIASVAETLGRSRYTYAEPNDIARISVRLSRAVEFCFQQWSLLTIQAPAAWA
jgi:hypothetical protein